MPGHHIYANMSCMCSCVSKTLFVTTWCWTWRIARPQNILTYSHLYRVIRRGVRCSGPLTVNAVCMCGVWLNIGRRTIYVKLGLLCFKQMYSNYIFIYTHISITGMACVTFLALSIQLTWFFIVALNQNKHWSPLTLSRAPNSHPPYKPCLPKPNVCTCIEFYMSRRSLHWGLLSVLGGERGFRWCGGWKEGRT